jgi:HDOD domain-containing protein
MRFLSGPINPEKQLIPARGNNVPSTAKNHPGNASPLAGVNAQKRLAHGTPVPWAALPPLITDSIAELDALLCAEPVNLTRVSNGFRAHPNLEFMIMRLGESLALPLDIPPCTIEEAAVGLGPDRLRALVHALSLIQQGAGEIAPSQDRAVKIPSAKDRAIATAVGDAPSTRFAEAGNLETLYLAGFLHWLGSDSQSALAADHPASISISSIQTLRVCSLTDIFMRDFITLIPFLDPAMLNPAQKPASEVSKENREEKVE